MNPKLFPKNFIKIQTPPTLQVRERRDGALVIEPPQYGDDPFTMRPTHTDGTGSVIKSETDTHAGTSTDISTGTTTGGATILQPGGRGFPVIGSRVLSARPTDYLDDGTPSPDSFEIVQPIPRGEFEEEGVRAVGEPRFREVTIDNVVRPPLDEAKPHFTFPDLGRPWEGSIVEAQDSDDDSGGDEDDTADSDNDNMMDDESDEDSQQDTTDFPGGFGGLLKHVKPPLAPKGTVGKVGKE